LDFSKNTYEKTNQKKKGIKPKRKYISRNRRFTGYPRASWEAG